MVKCMKHVVVKKVVGTVRILPKVTLNIQTDGVNVKMIITTKMNITKTIMNVMMINMFNGKKETIPFVLGM